MDEKVLEMAEALTDSLTARQIQASSRALLPQTHPDFDGENCVECINPILPGRLAMGRVRCTSCEAALERSARQFAR